MRKSGNNQYDNQDNSIVTFLVNALASNIFVILPPVLHEFICWSVINSRPNYFDRLPEAIISNAIASYLNPADKLNLALSYKENLRIFKPELRLSNYLHFVARGQQDEAERLLNMRVKQDDSYPNLQLVKEICTDYSGRTFECTAYEYAYWAKDVHMCRMLEAHMDDYTRSEMLKRCEAIENNGLRYSQSVRQADGTHRTEQRCTSHFDFTPLKTALEAFVEGFVNWNWEERWAAWMRVGVAQRDLPVHVINEYCRPDRSFEPLTESTFKEDKLPRVVTYYSFHTGRPDVSLYPLNNTASAGLGVNFALIRLVEHGGGAGWNVDGHRLAKCAQLDFEAIIRLDEVRTAGVKLSLETLKGPKEPRVAQNPSL